MAEETKIIRIVVDSSKAVDGSAAATRAFERMERQQKSVADSMTRLEDGLTRIGRILGGFVGARAVLELVDAFTKFQNSLKATGEQSSTLAAVSDRLFTAANKNGVEINALAQLYNRAAMSGKELGASQEKLLEFVDGVTAALRLQGGSTEAAQGALLQLSQALGSGTVRAEEFNSILEGALPIAQAAARGMDGMGGSVAKLRAAVVDGKVTSAQFFDALLKGFSETRSAAESQSLTLSAAFTSVKNSLTRYVGTANEAMGASNLLADGMEAVSKKLDGWSKLLTASQTIEYLGKVLASTRKEVEAISEALDRLDKWGRSTSIQDWVRTQMEELGVYAARGAAMFLEAFRQLPEQLGRIFVDAMNAAIRALSGGLSKINDTLADAAPWLGVKKGAVPTTLIPGGGASIGGVYDAMRGAADQAEASVRAQNAAAADARNRNRLINRQAGYETDEKLARAGGALVTGAMGFGSAMPSKAEQNAAERYAELVKQLENTQAAQEKMTAAARAGEQAFQAQQATVDAQNKTLDIFKTKLDDADPRLTKLRDLLLSIAQGKAAEAFNVATTQLEQQNKLLEAQIGLMDQAPEIQARELAIIKAKIEAEKAGSALTAEDIERRRAAIEVNERLKLQQTELQKAQEMWTEPLKQALRDIQTLGADAFAQLLENGNFSFQSLAQTFTKILKRMAAEFLALATIRPIMSVVVNAIGSTGLLPQSAVQSLGYGGSLSPTGGGGGLSLPSPGSMGGGGFLGGIGDWLNTPLTGPYAGMSPSSMAGVPMLSPSLMSPSTWGITPMAGIGAAAGIGSGIFQLINGKGSTGSMIGGIGSMIGGAVSLIPGFGQVAGPLIAIASSLLGGLFGNKEPTITNQAYGQLAYGSGGWGTTGGAWGPSANASELQGTLGSAGSSISSIFDALGGVKDPGKVWGLALQSFSQQYGKNGSFSNQTSFLVDPTGAKTQWGMGSTAADVGLGAASAQVAIRSIVGGAVGAISEAMKTALNTVGARSGGGSLQEVGSAITFVQAYDNLGKTAVAAEAALKKVNETFGAMKTTAESLGLSLEPVTAEMEKQRKAVATDFADSLGRELDPTSYALKDLAKWREQMIAENQYLLDNVTGALDQINNIEKVYGLKRAQIVEQGMQTSLVSLIKALLPGGGALANVSAADQFSGLQATYMATRAQAMAGDASALGRYASDAQAYLSAGLSYYGGNSQYVAAKNQVLTEAVGLAGGSGVYDQALTTLAGQLQAMQQMQAANQEDTARLLGLLQRYVTNKAA